MAKSMGVSQIEEFLEGPLVTWFSSCLDPSLKTEKLTYEQLIDGVLIHHVYLQMDLYCQDGDVIPSAGDASLRARNLKRIVGNIRQFFEEELNHIVILLPNVSRLSREPLHHISDAKLLLQLLLGCAVNCPRNERFIENIKMLEIKTQEAIAEYITQVLHVPGIMLSQDMLQMSNDPNLVAKAFEIVRNVCRVKEYYKIRLKIMARAGVNMDVSMLNQTMQISLDEDELEALSSTEVQDVLDSIMKFEREESQTKDAELLIETRNKLRKQQEELNRKIEDLSEARFEIKSYEEQLNKMRQENEKLVSDARCAKMYRDELDIANEKAERADRLEQDIARYKEKLAKMDFSEARLKELQQQIELLNENNQNLDEQLQNYKIKANQVIELQQHIFEMKQQMEELILEKEASREKNRELIEVNEQLEKLVRDTTQMTLDNGFIIESESDDSLNTVNCSLSEQLDTSAKCEALKLQLENRRLSSLLDSMKENTIDEKPTKLVNIYKENKKLSLMYESIYKQRHELTKKYELLEGAYNRMLKGALRNENHNRKREKEIAKLRELLKNQEEQLQALSFDISFTDTQKELSIANNQLSAEKAILIKSKEKLIGDLDHLKTIHDQLNVDYQQILQDRIQLRTQQREDKITLRKQAELIETLEAKIKALEDECTRLKSDEIRVEHAELLKEFDILLKSNQTLLVDYKQMRNELQSRLSQEPELLVKSQKIIELELELGKIQNRVEVLEQMNLVLEKDKCSLRQQNDRLIKQNDHLVMKALENLREHHKEELKNTDQVNNLRRQKEKLEEKIMDQYRRQDPPSSKKKSSIVKKTFVRVTRASSEFFLNRSRRSFAEESRIADQPSLDFEFTRCDDSAGAAATRPASRQSTASAYASGNYPRNRKSLDFLENFEPNKFSFDEPQAKSRKSLDFEVQARSRKSFDFAELRSLCNNALEEEDLDKTLPNLSNTEHIMASTMLENDDCSTFGNNKPIDLSFEEDENEESQENNNVEDSELMTANSKQSIWMDHGCA